MSLYEFLVVSFLGLIVVDLFFIVQILKRKQ